MGVGAHRIVNLEYEYSFSIGELLSYINTDELNFNASGVIEISVKDLKKDLRDEDISKETKKSIRDDIKAAEVQGNDYVSYYCF
jgi:hypothetical protein